MGMAVRAPTLAALVTLISGVAAAQGGETLSGSGVVISAKGEILTNAHVVEACQTITLKLASGPSRVHLVLARRGLPSRLRASRGTLPGPSRSRISMKPRRRGGSPSRRAISIPSCRQMLLHRAACAWSIWRSCLRTDSGARRCPWRHDRARHKHGPTTRSERPQTTLRRCRVSAERQSGDAYQLRRELCGCNARSKNFTKCRSHSYMQPTIKVKV